MLISIIKFIIAFIFCNYLLFTFQPLQGKLSLSKITCAYLFRILLGSLYGFVMLRYYPNDDTVLFHQMGIDEYIELMNNPRIFFGDFLNTDAFTAGKGFWEIGYYYLYNWEKWIFIKLLALFNCFSSGNYYVNVVLLNFFSFKGCHYLYAALKKWYPQSNILLYGLIFCFPPVTFWLSGIRGEALLIFFLGMFIFWLTKQGNGYLNKLLMALSLVGVLIIRNQVFFLLLPALIAYFICKRMAVKPVKIFLTVYLSIIGLVLISCLLPDQYNILLVISEKQASFKLLKSNSIFYLPDIDGSIYSYIKAVPYAVLNTFFRPLFIDSKGVLQLLASAETLFVVVVAFFWLAIVSKKRSEVWSSSLFLLLFFFAITAYLMIGLIVYYPGVIIRYRSIPELFLLICFSLDLGKLLPAMYK